MSAALFKLVPVLAAVIALLLGVAPLRRHLLTGVLLRSFRRRLPEVSATEQQALDAGTVGWDGQLFSGRPDWNAWFALPAPRLAPEEQAFLDGPVEALCALVDEWDVSHHRHDLPPAVWAFLRAQGFFGLIIPREYGGRGFSALAHSAVIMKVASRSPTAAATVMVPNSLGPAELLLHYGTEAQRRHYLPRLARGEEIPCFALTGPEAGSDAASIPDTGVVCLGQHEGREVLGMRITWNKRYITLAPVATLLGLAFRLVDPQRLLGGAVERGITVALVPTTHPGVQIGRRHLPLDGAFMNGPTRGTDVFVPLDWVIGGHERVGQGWRMLVECLAAGRGISLPSSAAGAAKLAALTTGAYSRVRRQFRVPIGRLEGVQEALTRLAADAYLLEALRSATAAAVDRGEKPAVLSAVAKYHSTERARRCIADAMDVHGGKGICLGPSNYLGRAHQQMPVSITVEGANILTRSLIIFGQGAVRCHPHLQAEMAAARLPDAAAARRAFDAALCAHAAYLARNAWRAFTRGLGAGGAPAGPAAVQVYLRRLDRLAAAFALVADVALLVLGGALKRRERLSARLGDVLSLLYLASCTLKRFCDEGAQEADRPVVDWILADACHAMEEALLGVCANFPLPWLGTLLRALAFPRGRRCAPPADRIAGWVAELLIVPSAARARLTAGIYVPQGDDDPVGRLEQALALAEQLLPLRGAAAAPDPARAARYEALRAACIAVDDFAADPAADAAQAAAAAGATPVAFEEGRYA